MTREEQQTIRAALDILQKEAHRVALEKGWYEPSKTLGETLLMYHSEVTEALDDYREVGDNPTELRRTDHRDEKGKPLGFAIELADIIIRVLDTSEYLGIDLAEAILVKHAFNETRERRHGNKRL